MINAENKIGISTACFYPELTEDAFDIICGLGVRVCEIFINTHSETKLDYLRGIKLKAEHNNIKIAAVHPYFSAYESFLFFAEYKRRFLDSIDLYKPFFEAARFLGADYVIMHGMAGNIIKISIEEYSERFLIVAVEAKKYGCELLHENLGLINNYLPDLKNIKFALDFKHTIAGRFDIADIIGKMSTHGKNGENIAHIHLNDMILENAEKVRDCRLPFAGELDYGKIFSKLADVNYIGSFIIEVYKNSYKNLTEISDSIDKFRNFLKNI